MLRTVINGQSVMKSELITKIEGVEKKFTSGVDGLETEMKKGFKRLEERIDKIGLQVARLEDDTPTIEEFDELKSRVDKISSVAAV